MSQHTESQLNPQSIAVVIPVKEDKRIEACLQSIIDAQYHPDALFIIVVDNNSEAVYAEWLDSLCTTMSESSDIRIERLKEPTPGSYSARNAGIEYVLENTLADIIAFTDSDCTVSNTWLNEIAQTLTTEQADAVLGLALGNNDNIIAEYEQRMYEQIVRAFAETDAPLQRIDTRNVAVRATAIKKSGLFLPILFGGDMEYGARLHSNNCIIRYNAQMNVEHHNPTDFSSLLKKRIRQNYGNMRILEHCDTAYVEKYLPQLLRYKPSTINRLRVLELRLVATLEFPLANVTTKILALLPDPIGYFYYKLLTKRAVQLGQISYVLEHNS